MLVEVESACPMQLVMSVFYSAGGERKCWLELILLVCIPWGKLQIPWKSMMLAIECLLRNKNSGFQDYSLSIEAVKCNAALTWQRRIQSLCQDQSVLHPGLPHQVARRWNFNHDVSRNLDRIQFYRARIPAFIQHKKFRWLVVSPFWVPFHFQVPRDLYRDLLLQILHANFLLQRFE